MSSQLASRAGSPLRAAAGPGALVLVWAVLVSALAQVPNVAARRLPPPDDLYVGSLAPWAIDVTYHLSFAAQAERGEILFEDKYNGDRVSTRLVFQPWFLAIGWLARLTGVPLVDSSIAARFVVGIALLLAAHRLAVPWLDDRTQRAFFMVLAPFGAGLGGLGALAGWPVPLDAAALELNAFQAISEDLIAPVTTALLFVCLDRARAVLLEPTWPRAIGLGACGVVLGTVHPHDLLVTLHATVLVAALIQAKGGPRGTWRAVVGLLAGSLPLAAWSLHVLAQEPLFWDYVGLQDDFSVVPVALGLGVPGALAAFEAFGVARGERFRFGVLLAWLASALALLFVPLAPAGQFYLLHGVQVGAAILAARVLGRAFAQGRRGVALALVAVSLTTCLWHVARWHHLLANPGPDRFVASGLVPCLRWASEHLPGEAVVLAPEAESRPWPPFAGTRVFAAQEEQTADYDRWKAEASAFFEASSASGTEDFMRRHRVDAVVLPLRHADAAPRMVAAGLAAATRCDAATVFVQPGAAR